MLIEDSDNVFPYALGCVPRWSLAVFQSVDEGSSLLQNACERHAAFCSVHLGKRSSISLPRGALTDTGSFTASSLSVRQQHSPL
jgi:hypothetical protein